jgi:DNA polymerase-3 subunit delta
MQQPKTNAVTTVMALATQTLAIAFGRALLDSGTPPGRIDNELFGLLKEAGSAYTGRSWGDAVRCWSRALDKWTAVELDRALAALLDCDAALKESRISSDEQLLQSLILTLCARGRVEGRRVA